MFEKLQENGTFHGETAVMRLAMTAIVLSWVTLVAYLVGFANDMSQVLTQWEQISLSLPSDFLGQAAAWSGFLRTPLNGLFYFVVLQGAAQLMYLGLDIFYGQEDLGESDSEAEASA